ncbi:unnamed protein product [Polarella glacialis]|uniref:Uncharacterized protein n=1 Tax=Polarella glacialis TaxID=89957 RepID=A0A813EMQ6_POLGL|nr:unnamed protein product [Polarella glacialis]
MEVIVSGLEKLPEGSLISVRAGNTRRQGTVGSLRGRSLRFPQALLAGEALKIDVLKQVTGQRLVLRPSEESYRIALDGEGEGLDIQLRVSADRSCAPGGNDDDCRSVGASEVFTIASAETVSKKGGDSASTAKEYLEQHALLSYFQGLLKVVVQERPADPYRFLWQQLGASMSPEEAPTSPPRKQELQFKAMPPKELQVEEGPTMAPSQKLQVQEAETKLCHSPEEGLLPQGCQEEKAPLTPHSTGTTRATDSSLRDAPNVDEDAQEPSSPSFAACFALLGQGVPAELSAEPCPASLQLDGADAELGELKRHLREVLEEAAGTGDLQRWLRELVASPALLPGRLTNVVAVDIEELRDQLCGILQGSADSGELLAAVKKVAQSQQSADVEALKHLSLSRAVEDGTLEAALANMQGKEASPAMREPADVESIRAQIADPMYRAVEDGTLEASLAKATGSEQEVRDELESSVTTSEAEVGALKMRLFGSMSRAVEDGTLEAALENMRGEEALESRLAAVSAAVGMQRVKISTGAVEEGSGRKGSRAVLPEMEGTDEPLQSASEVCPAMRQQADIESIRAQLADSLFRSELSFKLLVRGALQSNRGTPEPTSRMGTLAAGVVEDGTLEAALPKMQGTEQPLQSAVEASPSMRPPADLESIRAQIADSMYRAVEDGTLEASLVKATRSEQEARRDEHQSSVTTLEAFVAVVKLVKHFIDVSVLQMQTPAFSNHIV